MTTSSKLLPVHKRFDVTFSHGEGVYLFGTDGKKYLDFGAGIAVNALGHCHPKMVDALTNQARKLWHVSNIYNISELNKYAEKLVESTFADYVFFCNSGAEGLECAIKMIRRHFYVKGQAQKNRIITFTGAFHGRTIATISAAAKKKYVEELEDTGESDATSISENSEEEIDEIEEHDQLDEQVEANNQEENYLPSIEDNELNLISNRLNNSELDDTQPAYHLVEPRRDVLTTQTMVRFKCL